MTEKDYRASEGISRSELWRLMDSPEKFKYLQEHPEPPSPALVFGAVVHKLFLEPEDFVNEYVVVETTDRRTKAGKEAWRVAELSGKTPVSVADYQTASAMVEKLNNTPFVGKLLDGAHEDAMRWTDELTGEVCKIRMDCLTYIGNTPVIIDYKTTTDASPEGFIKSALNYGYDFQTGMYTEGVEKLTGIKPRFVFIVQEKTAPYAINIMEADELFIKRGRDTFRYLIGLYHECKTTDNWYGYMGAEPSIGKLYLPAWAVKE